MTRISLCLRSVVPTVLLTLSYPSMLTASPVEHISSVVIDYSPSNASQFLVAWDEIGGRRMVLHDDPECAVFLTRWNPRRPQSARASNCASETLVLWPDDDMFIAPPGHVRRNRPGNEAAPETIDMLEFCAPSVGEKGGKSSREEIHGILVQDFLEQAISKLAPQARSITAALRGQNIDAKLLLARRPFSWTGSSGVNAFWVVLKGQARVTVAGKDHQLRPKNILFIPPFQSQSIKILPSGSEPFAALQVSISKVR